MANRFRERQAELEPSRVQYAIEQLTGLGYEVERLGAFTGRNYNKNNVIIV